MGVLSELFFFDIIFTNSARVPIEWLVIGGGMLLMWSEFLVWMEWKEFLRSTVICGAPSLFLFLLLPRPLLLFVISTGFWFTILFGLRILEVFVGMLEYFQ